MTDTQQLLLIIAVGVTSATAAWTVTWHYWRQKHVLLLRQVAAERSADETEIRNARIINRIYGDMRAVDVANIADRGTGDIDVSALADHATDTRRSP